MPNHPRRMLQVVAVPAALTAIAACAPGTQVVDVPPRVEAWVVAVREGVPGLPTAYYQAIPRDPRPSPGAGRFYVRLAADAAGRAPDQILALGRDGRVYAIEGSVHDVPTPRGPTRPVGTYADLRGTAGEAPRATLTFDRAVGARFEYAPAPSDFKLLELRLVPIATDPAADLLEALPGRPTPEPTSPPTPGPSPEPSPEPTP